MKNNYQQKELNLCLAFLPLIKIEKLENKIHKLTTKIESIQATLNSLKKLV